MDKQYYQDNQILNSQMVDNPLHRDYIPYFQALNKPKAIFLLTGMIIEFYSHPTFSALFKDDFLNISTIFQLNLNNPHFCNKQKYFFTLFNSDQTLLIRTACKYVNYLEKQHIYASIGIYSCHPLTSIDTFINAVEQQLGFSKTNRCLFSYKNSYELLTSLAL